MPKELTQLLEIYPKSLFHKALDLGSAATVREDLFKDFVPNKTPLHGFVNNAAMAYDDIITNLNVDRVKEMYEVNVFTPFNITKYAIRNMIFNRVHGSIVHVSSISAHTGYKGLSMYAGSKAALEGFSKNTAREWGERGVRSNCLVAGFMETAMSATLDTSQKDRIYKRTSLKVPTSMQSVALMIEFLLSDKAISVTGQNIHVDSGTI
ncbi:3-oxoacyl-[acyl-carrier protein] reductase [Nonlabens marinus S1-08]|uniref:3-oxoacyl-[acyl-carrier protein] reductase n=2 Tax=Nonlabens TaxID=363408 RepID=W8VS99_9FLAO|nr:3-oxoacyl-[acyl-carrier protein] reductase [Nonlabens marinus S1-08]